MAEPTLVREGPSEQNVPNNVDSSAFLTSEKSQIKDPRKPNASTTRGTKYKKGGKKPGSRYKRGNRTKILLRSVDFKKMLKVCFGFQFKKNKHHEEQQQQELAGNSKSYVVDDRTK
eukprot:g7269.t1